MPRRNSYMETLNDDTFFFQKKKKNSALLKYN